MQKSVKAVYWEMFGMSRWEYLNSTRKPRDYWWNPTYAAPGMPVAGTGKYKRRKYKNGAGVSAHSRVLSHHYADEGDKGTTVRRAIRRRERRMWLSEWEDEQRSEIMELCAYDSWE